MDKLFQIGDFIFRLCCPAEVMARGFRGSGSLDKWKRAGP